MKKNSLIKISIAILFSLYSVAINAAKPPYKKSKKPNYSLVFPQNKVNSIEISLTKSQWDSIRADMKQKFGNDFGKGGFGRNRPPFSPKDTAKRMPPMMPPNFGDGPPMMNFGQGEPNYVSAAVKFKGKIYPKVGFD